MQVQIIWERSEQEKCLTVVRSLRTTVQNFFCIFVIPLTVETTDTFDTSISIASNIVLLNT